VESKELWASHAAFLNDSTEIVYIKEVLNTVTSELKARYDLSSFVQEFLEFVELWFTDRILTGYDVFLACFCENGDLLSQWRGYPSTGGGYAIGFNAPVIAQKRMLSRVVYELEEQKETLRTLLSPSCDALAAGSDPDRPRGYLHRAMMTALGMAAANVAECSFCFKHPAFKEEQEWRLIRLSALDREPPYRTAPSFRARVTGLLPYVPLAIDRPGDSEPPIGEVIVGPSAHPDLAVRAAQQLLAKHGYENGQIVKRSKIPLRV
jgi:hypothetical protein